VTEKEAQEEILRREFSRQAHNFEAPRSLFRDTSILEWIGGHLPVAPGARILDVAGGTGRLARHLAAGADGATGVVVDLTDEMLSAGLRSALDDGRTDVVFVRGDATALPFPAGESIWSCVASRCTTCRGLSSPSPRWRVSVAATAWLR
jgi:ubiquinone/menaquinone biosynthesis C-methylase UbiE